MSELSIFELRQYTLLGGRREPMIDLFEREFVETQNAAGMTILGRYRDLDDPDRFVWLRGFGDMAARRQALTAFYGSPVWEEHGPTANATMRDSDNVLLLRSAVETAGLEGALSARPPVMRVAIHDLADVPADTMAAFFQEVMAPMIVECGAEPVTALTTACVENTFPRLPLRGDRVFAWVVYCESLKVERDFSHRLATQSGWRDRMPDSLFPAFARKAEVLRLAAV